jgi:hypothetical protein
MWKRPRTHQSMQGTSFCKPGLLALLKRCGPENLEPTVLVAVLRITLRAPRTTPEVLRQL